VDWSEATLVVFFAAIGAACLAAILLGLPGVWALLALAAIVELADGGLTIGADDPVTFGWSAIGIGAGLALVGEAIEAAAGAMGAKWGGASRRGMVGAFLGGIAGAVAGSVLIPIPLIGTLIGALAGTFGGAYWAERTGERQRSSEADLRAAGGALVGRLAGTFGKVGIGVAVWILIVYSAFTRAAQS
jgi:uncharacterized protein YqgC (DUF456 family)